MRAEELTERLNELVLGLNAPGEDLAGAAELVVTDPDGSEAYRATLARMWRMEDGTRIWIRPLVAGYWTGSMYVFSLALIRRRALTVDKVTTDGDAIVLVQPSGQTARIQPVGGGPAAELLERWDTFMLNTLSADDEEALEELLDDSWHGNWS